MRVCQVCGGAAAESSSSQRRDAAILPRCHGSGVDGGTRQPRDDANPANHGGDRRLREHAVTERRRHGAGLLSAQVGGFQAEQRA